MNNRSALLQGSRGRKSKSKVSARWVPSEAGGISVLCLSQHLVVCQQFLEILGLWVLRGLPPVSLDSSFSTCRSVVVFPCLPSPWDYDTRESQDHISLLFTYCASERLPHVWLASPKGLCFSSYCKDCDKTYLSGLCSVCLSVSSLPCSGGQQSCQNRGPLLQYDLLLPKYICNDPFPK